MGSPPVNSSRLPEPGPRGRAARACQAGGRHELSDAPGIVWRRGAGILAAAWLLAGALTAGAQTNGHAAAGVLRDHLRLTEAELAALGRGLTFTRTLPPTHRREIAIVGGVRITAPADVFVERFKSLDPMRSSRMVLQIQKFSSPPRLDDLAALTLDRQDLQSLRKCRVGACQVRLPAHAIRRFAALDWNAPDSAGQATAIFKQMLLEQLTAYLAGGNASLVQYDDHAEPLRLADEMDAILRATPLLVEHVPEFREYLQAFPHGRLANVEDFVYWSKEEFGFKPVIGLTHVSLYRPDPASDDTIIASKQIYANHYFDGSVAVMAALGDRGQDPGFYLLYLNRSRNSKLAGFLGVLSRGLVQSRGRASLEAYLKGAKQRLERAPAPAASERAREQTRAGGCRGH